MYAGPQDQGEESRRREEDEERPVNELLLGIVGEQRRRRRRQETGRKYRRVWSSCFGVISVHFEQRLKLEVILLQTKKRSTLTLCLPHL